MGTNWPSPPSTLNGARSTVSTGGQPPIPPALHPPTSSTWSGNTSTPPAVHGVGNTTPASKNVPTMFRVSQTRAVRSAGPVVPRLPPTTQSWVPTKKDACPSRRSIPVTLLITWLMTPSGVTSMISKDASGLGFPANVNPPLTYSRTS